MMEYSVTFSSLAHHISCKIFFVIVAILCVLYSHGTEGLSADGLALLDFKNGLESQGTALGNWRASDASPIDASPCNWEGVGCSQSGLVTSLVVANAGLAGPISPSLGKLEELQNLNLTQNMLSGSIPLELGNCSHLTTLVLDNNQLTGSIPATLGKLQALQTLVLSTNELTGEIPAELANCTSLRSLFISSNQLHGSVPRGIYNISNLRQLLVYSNNLTGDITEGMYHGNNHYNPFNLLLSKCVCVCVCVCFFFPSNFVM